MGNMDNSMLENPRTLIIIVVSLVLGLVGGYIYSQNRVQSEIVSLYENNTAIQSSLQQMINNKDEINQSLQIKENELSSAQTEIETLGNNIETLENEIAQLEDEVDFYTASYDQLESDYLNILTEYNRLTLETQYRLTETLVKEDFALSRIGTTRTYIGPNVQLSGETTKIDYSIMCEAGSIKPSAQLRFYKSGTSLRAYTRVIKLVEEPDLDLYLASDSFSVILDEEDYRVELIIEHGSLAASSQYPSSIHIWSYR
jgi:hypothetical protein